MAHKIIKFMKDMVFIIPFMFYCFYIGFLSYFLFGGGFIVTNAKNSEYLSSIFIILIFLSLGFN